MARIGFIGLGNMGLPMALNLIKAGHQVEGVDLNPGAIEKLKAAGGSNAELAKVAAARCDVVITMLPAGKHVREVYLGSGGIVENANPGTLLIDMTTSSPRLAVTLAEAAAAKGCAALDAPVSGGDIGARNAALSIMLGGDADAFARAQPVFAKLGKAIRHMGGPGAGQHTKMANQIAIASAVMGVAEALTYARRAGLDGEAVVAALAPGAAGSTQLNVMGPKMLAGDFAPGFMVKHFLKDLGIAVAEAEAMGLALPGLAQSRRLFERIAAELGGDVGTQAIIAAYR